MLNQSLDYTNPMKFDEFWNLVSTSLTTPKKFVAQSNIFEAKYSGGRIMVSTSHGSLWTIDRSTVRDIWNKALKLHEKLRFIHTNYSDIRTSAYIISIMKHFVIDESKVE